MMKKEQEDLRQLQPTTSCVAFAVFLLQFKVSAKEIARVPGIGYKAAFFMVRKLRRSFYARRIYERLQGEVEIEEAYVKVGLKGKRDLRRGY